MKKNHNVLRTPCDEEEVFFVVEREGVGVSYSLVSFELFSCVIEKTDENSDIEESEKTNSHSIPSCAKAVGGSYFSLCD